MTAVGERRIINGTIHRPCLELTGTQSMHATPCDVDVIGMDVTPVPDPIVFDRSDDRRAYSHVRIENDVALVRHRKDKAFNQFDGELTRMNRLFDMVILDVWENPNVAGVFSKRIAGKLSDLRTFEIFLVGIFRWYANRIEMKRVVIRLGEPKDRLVSSR